ncbi:MAG: DNA double-strand break repair nuclease NurA [Candidatus Micrarchaeota archaeon]
MYERITEIAKRIAETEESERRVAELLRARDVEIFPDALERRLTREVKPGEVNGLVGAVDGGLLAQEFHGIDLVVTRAVGVVFGYEDSKRVSHKYYPRALVAPEVYADEYLETHEFLWYKSLLRLRGELSTARGMIEKLTPQFMLMDGSVVPQITDKPGEGSAIRGLYLEVIEEYKNLYKAADLNNCSLVGVIKDSRGKRFVEIMRRYLGKEGEILGKAHDTGFLDFLLKEGERTFTFRYSSTEKEHQVLKDLNDWGARVDAFYLKAVEGDRPLRVEFLEGKRKFEEIASLVYTLSRINKNYAYPAVLIEADLRAALDQNEIDRVYGELVTKTGMRSSLRKLRRDSRPFR